MASHNCAPVYMDTSESQSTRFFIENNIKIPDDPFYISMTAIEEETYYLQFDIGSAIRVSSVLPK